MNNRPKQPKYARNKKYSCNRRFRQRQDPVLCETVAHAMYVKGDFPTSYIVTDPKGTLILETGKMLQRYKYRIKVLNTINFKNP